jgi:Domain of unknown function (DUF5666)
MKTSMLVFALFLCNSLSEPASLLIAEDSRAQSQPVVHTWENVGEITQISGKILAIRRTVRISDSSWSLEPGAVSDGSQLGNGDQIMARGKTMPDGNFDATRIYMLSASIDRPQATGGKTMAVGADHGGPESKVPAGMRYPGDTGLEGRGRTGPYPGGSPAPPGTPGGGGQGSPGGLQSSRGIARPRFLPGDLEGQIEEVGTDHLSLSQSFVVDKDTVIRSYENTLKIKDLRVGQRVAVTIKDEVDSKARARKATVIRLLP